MITAATNRVIATIRRVKSTEADIRDALQAFCDEAHKTSQEEVNMALNELSKYFFLADKSRAAFLAIICGALIEKGYDPQAIAESLVKRLASLLKSSVALFDFCLGNMPKSAREELDVTGSQEVDLNGMRLVTEGMPPSLKEAYEKEHPEWIEKSGGQELPEEDEEQDPIELFEKSLAQAASAMPENHAAWEALKKFYLPAIAVFSRSPQWRAAARPLREMAAKIEPCHEAGHWLECMLSVLDNEPILVIEPGTMQGILGRISGIADNFQLNILLMDQFPQPRMKGRPRVSKQIADVARGIGPEETNDSVTGFWNLYTWKAIRPGFQFIDRDERDLNKVAKELVWNEGKPADIPLFEGRRVVLLGPPWYTRTWNASRIFSAMRAQLVCERTLAKDEVEEWLNRMIAARNGY